MKPNLFRISMFPNVELKEQNLKELLNIFDEDDKITPEQWGNDERVRLKYDKEEIIDKVSSESNKFDYIFLYRNKKVIKYDCWFSTKKVNRSYLKVEFSKNMNKKHWEYFFDVSDSIARITKPRFGVTTMWSDEMLLKDDEEKAMFENMLMSRGPVPANFLSEGPLGVGLRTYFNEDIINLFGRDFLLNAPAYVEELDWGGIRMDLVEEPWNTEMDIVFESWIKVMDYLKEANVFSEYIYRGEDVMAKVVTSEKWKTFVNTL